MLQEGLSFSGNANNPTSFTLTLGGRYMVSVAATFGGGSVELQALAADGTTWVSVKDHFVYWNGTAQVAAEVAVGSFGSNGAYPLWLAPGTYRFNITTATSVAAAIARCPLA